MMIRSTLLSAVAAIAMSGCGVDTADTVDDSGSSDNASSTASGETDPLSSETIQSFGQHDSAEPEQDENCGGCGDDERCASGTCVPSCEDCVEDDACSAFDGRSECKEAWDCERAVIENVYQGGGVCSSGWSCDRGDFMLECEPTDDENPDRFRCTCSLDGKEGRTFEWSGSLCDSRRAGYLSVINGQCGWAIP
jgi:hypothetical protein